MNKAEYSVLDASAVYLLPLLSYISMRLRYMCWYSFLVVHFHDLFIHLKKDKKSVNQRKKQSILLLVCLLLSFSSDFVQLSILSPFTFEEDLYSIPLGKETYPLLRASS